MGERTQRGAPTVAGIVWRERGFACTLSLRQCRVLQEWFRKGAKTRCLRCRSLKNDRCSPFFKKGLLFFFKRRVPCSPCATLVVLR